LQLSKRRPVSSESSYSSPIWPIFLRLIFLQPGLNNWATMFKLFGAKENATSSTTTLATLDKLSETLEMLEKKERVLIKKAAAEIEKAKEFTRAKNKRAAIQCLKRKKLYEQQVEQLGNFQLRIHDQYIPDSGRAGSMKYLNIDDVDKTMDEINEQTENLRLIQDALAAPIGTNDFDEDELEAELEELEGAELEEQLLQPAITTPAASVRQPTRPAAKRDPEEDELAELQREMAL
ncbi:hypothetical protein KSS87_000507, partial [Heliosperma pusillum]